MAELFRTILYTPLFNGFVALYNLIPDVGVVILIITILIKGALYPLTSKSIRAQKSLTDLQPKLDAMKREHKDNQQKLAQETMRIYKENKVNPLGSCLPLLIQLPVFLALYWVLRDGLTTTDFHLLYPFVSNPVSINPMSLGVINLALPSTVLAFVAGAAQYWQAKMLSRTHPPKKAGAGAKDEDMMSMMNKQMLYVMPVMTVVIGFQLPGGLSLYWFLSTFLTAIQQKILFGKNKKDGNSGNGSAIEGTLV